MAPRRAAHSPGAAHGCRTGPSAPCTQGCRVGRGRRSGHRAPAPCTTGAGTISWRPARTDAGSIPRRGARADARAAIPRARRTHGCRASPAWRRAAPPGWARNRRGSACGPPPARRPRPCPRAPYDSARPCQGSPTGACSWRTDRDCRRAVVVATGAGAGAAARLPPAPDTPAHRTVTAHDHIAPRRSPRRPVRPFGTRRRVPNVRVLSHPWIPGAARMDTGGGSRSGPWAAGRVPGFRGRSPGAALRRTRAPPGRWRAPHGAGCRCGTRSPPAAPGPWCGPSPRSAGARW